MIGLVVVSHSQALAHAARDLALEMVPGDQPVVACAGGLDETTFGTDAERIATAITEADSPDGVLVLMDLGSALLSTEMALEFLDPDLAGRVRLSAAPIVEGLLAAVVTAASGAPLDAVMREADQGLRAKADHLGIELPSSTVAPAEDEVESSDWQRLSLEVPNRLGLHARPAAAFVNLLASSGVTTQVFNRTRDIGPVNGTSLMGVAGLGATHGDELEIRAQGDEPAVRDLFDRLKQFAENNFGDDPAQNVARNPVAQTFSGPLRRLDLEVVASPRPAEDPHQEQARLDGAIQTARAELTGLVELARRQVSDDAAEMVAAQLVFLDDGALLSPIRTAIASGSQAETAWTEQLEKTRGLFDGMTDDYLRAREQDVWSLQHRVLSHLVGQAFPDIATLDGVIVTKVVDAPTAIALDPDKVIGVVTEGGGRLGHGALILANRQILLAADAAGEFRDVADGETVHAQGS